LDTFPQLSHLTNSLLYSRNEKTAASSDGFCGAVAVLNRWVEFVSLSGQSYIPLEYY